MTCCVRSAGVGHGQETTTGRATVLGQGCSARSAKTLRASMRGVLGSCCYLFVDTSCASWCQRPRRYDFAIGTCRNFPSECWEARAFLFCGVFLVSYCLCPPRCWMPDSCWRQYEVLSLAVQRSDLSYWPRRRWQSLGILARMPWACHQKDLVLVFRLQRLHRLLPWV